MGKQFSQRAKHAAPLRGPDPLFIKAILALVAAVAIVGTAYWFITKTISDKAQKEEDLKTLSLLDVRAKYHSLIMKYGPSGPYFSTAPEDAEVFRYTSKGNGLIAWILKPKATRKTPPKRAAVMYLHGGSALGVDDATDAAPFLKAGYIVMLPTFRGENGNPGYYEMCYGELEDAAAAIDVLAKRPDVDPSKIYVAGNSGGGTMTMLLAECSNKIAKAAACGGIADMHKPIKNKNQVLTKHEANYNGPYQDCPAEKTDLEMTIRSPYYYTKDLTCPLLLLYGDTPESERKLYALAKDMAEKATTEGKQVKLVQISDATHDSAMRQAIPKMLAFFSGSDTKKPAETPKIGKGKRRSH